MHGQSVHLLVRSITRATLQALKMHNRNTHSRTHATSPTSLIEASIVIAKIRVTRVIGSLARALKCTYMTLSRAEFKTDVVVAAQVRLADQHPLLRHRPRSLPGSLAATVVILIIRASASVSAAAAAAAAASCGYVCCWCCWCCPCSSCCICTCHHLHLHFTQSIRPPRAPLPTQLRAFS